MVIKVIVSHRSDSAVDVCALLLDFVLPSNTLD